MIAGWLESSHSMHGMYNNKHDTQCLPWKEQHLPHTMCGRVDGIVRIG